MSDNVIAAIAGAMTASFSKYKSGPLVMLQTCVIGFFSAYYLALNLVIVTEKYLGVTLLYSASYFLCALYGADVFAAVKRRFKTWAGR